MKLTPTMQEALEYIREHGISRHPGGFWAHAEWRGPGSGPWFGTSTIAALHSRKLIEYTEWVRGRSGDFPVRASVIASEQREG